MYIYLDILMRTLKYQELLKNHRHYFLDMNWNEQNLNGFLILIQLVQAFHFFQKRHTLRSKWTRLSQDGQGFLKKLRQRHWETRCVLEITSVKHDSDTCLLCKCTKYICFWANLRSSRYNGNDTVYHRSEIIAAARVCCLLIFLEVDINNQTSW